VRTLHRWIMTVAAAFLLYMAVSGLLLQGDDLLALLHPGARSAPELKSIKEFAAGPPYFSVLSNVDEAAPPLAEAALPQMLRSGFATAERLAGDAPITAVELRTVGTRHQAVVTFGAAEQPQLAVIDADSGALIARGSALPPPEAESSHDAIKFWHRGNVLGLTGVWLNLLTGLSLAILAFSGVYLYLDMHARRRKLGTHGIFWS